MKKSEIVYHVTAERNVLEITRNGFVPKNERTNYPPRIYFGRTIQDAVKVLIFKIAERRSADHRLLILRARLQGLKLFPDTDLKVIDSFYVEESVGLERFDILKNMDVSVHTLPMGFMNMYYRDLAKYVETRVTSDLQGRE